MGLGFPVSIPSLPMPRHQGLKKTDGWYQINPLIIATTTQAITANQLILLKSISTSK
jgi:hypothetical protein